MLHTELIAGQRQQTDKSDLHDQPGPNNQAPCFPSDTRGVEQVFSQSEYNSTCSTEQQFKQCLIDFLLPKIFEVINDGLEDAHDQTK